LILKTIFSKSVYAVFATIIFVTLFISLSFLSEYLFFLPYVILHVDQDRILGFVLIITIAVLSGLVLSMNVYRIKSLQRSTKKIGGGLAGSIIGTSAGACSCGPVGFAIISTFGTVGGIATSFLTNYEIPIRLVALAILSYTYYATTKAISFECKIKS
jgi:hypothetical protein